MRWDAKKKKYLPVLVSADGKVLRKETRKNEAGKKMKGDVEKSDLYAKWSKNSKARIQNVGEMEVCNAGLLNLKARNAAAATTIDDDDDQPMAESGISLVSGQKEKKPIVPFHGHVEDKYLTNKQKRMKKKRDGLLANKVTKDAKGRSQRLEIKSATDLKKTKKTKLKHKLKTNPHFRKEHGKKQRDAWWERHAEKIAKRAARPRSFAIPKGKVDEKKKKSKRHARKDVYLK